MKKFGYPPIFILLIILLLVIAQHFTPKETDWTENFDNQKKSPYGLRVFSDIVLKVFLKKILNLTMQKSTTTSC